MKINLSIILTFLLTLPFAIRALQPQTIVVQNGGNVQAAINSSNPGDKIVLQPGTYSAFTVTKGNISISSSGNPIVPLIPGVQDNQFAKIITNSSAPAIEFAQDVSNVSISGLIATNIGGSVYTPELVLVGSPSSGTIPAGHKPNHITFDNFWCREATNDTSTPDSPNTTADRCFNVSADSVTITHSRVAGFRAISSSSGAQSSNAILLAGATNFTVADSYLESWFVPIFMSAVADSPNKASLSNPTYDPNSHIWSADFSNVANLNVGDLVAMKVINGHTPATNNSHSNESVVFEVGKVQSISGSHITGISWGTFDGNINGGNPLLQVPDSLAQWNGYTNDNINILRNQIVTNFAASEYVWTHSGGLPTSLPRAQQDTNHAGNAPKSAIEIKSGRNVTIDGNIQDGWYTSFILLSPRNQGNTLTSGGAPWAGDFNIRVTNNNSKRMKNWDRVYSYGTGGPQLEDNEYSDVRSGPALYQNNLFEGGMEALLQNMGAADNVTVVHNTYPGSTATGGSLVTVQGAVCNNFIFKDNAVSHNQYGFNNQLGQNPWVNKQQDHNVIIDNRTSDTKIGDGSLDSRYPGDFITASQSTVGWSDPINGNYRLSSTSPFKGKASDGKDPGVDMDALLAAQSSQTFPTPTPTVTPTPVVPSPSPTPSPSSNRVTVDVNGVIIRGVPSVNAPSIGTQNAGSRGTLTTPCVTEASSGKVFCYVAFDNQTNGSGLGVSGYLTQEHLVFLNPTPTPTPVPSPSPSPASIPGCVIKSQSWTPQGGVDLVVHCGP